MNSNLAGHIAFALLAGVAIAYQPVMNTRLAQAVAHPVQAAVVSFFTGFAVLFIAALLMRTPLPLMERVAAAPWWAWMGGALGAFFVTTAIVLVPRMGSATYVACIIAGQLAASVLIDHFGHLGVARHPFTLGRAAGLVLLIAGIVCIRRF